MSCGFKTRLAAAACLLLLGRAPVVNAAPPSVFMEELTWVEVRDAIADGYTTVILPTGGTEQNGPHMVLGKHNEIVKYAAGEIARRLGNALVAPVMAYVPEGSIEPPDGQMKFPGTISLPEPVFTEVVEYAALSLKANGFKDVVFIADSGGNVGGLDKATRELNKAWRNTPVRAHFATHYMRGQKFIDWLVSQGETEKDIGYHAGIMDTSVAMAVDPSMIRRDKLASGQRFSVTGVWGDPTHASVAYGKKGLAIQIDGAVTQIRELIANHDN